jgi:hypothetical protein
MHKKTYGWLFAGLLGVIPVPAFADIGVPLIFVTFPGMIIALIPIIFIEAYIIKKAGVLYKLALKWTALANVVSTLIGIPLASIALAVPGIVTGGGRGYAYKIETFWGKISAVTWQAASFVMYESDPNPHWMIPVATLMLLIPFFGASYLIERAILRRGIKTVSQKEIDQRCFKANIVSYLLLALVPIQALFSSAF